MNLRNIVISKEWSSELQEPIDEPTIGAGDGNNAHFTPSAIQWAARAAAEAS